MLRVLRVLRVRARGAAARGRAWAMHAREYTSSSVRYEMGGTSAVSTCLKVTVTRSSVTSSARRESTWRKWIAQLAVAHRLMRSSSEMTFQMKKPACRR